MKNTEIAGTVSWECPSNIAIVKYWGKHGRQLPRNTSVSLTLSEAKTRTSVSYQVKEEKGVSIDFLFEGVTNEAFSAKIKKFLSSIVEEMPFIQSYHLQISSQNTFPHSSGIASSASAMAALVMCLCDIERIGKGESSIDFNRASYFARLGSGSASRSVLPHVATWGQHADIEGSSDLYAIEINDVDDVFKGFHDDILIISSEEKSVSSTAGHALMDHNPYAEARYRQAQKNTSLLLQAMKEGDLEAFGQIAEDEAMTLHALMMCSDPSYVLMKPHTLKAIEEIRSYRKMTSHPVYFTLDAGPNIHLLYPDHIAHDIAPWIEMALKPLCVDGRIIRDTVGIGPKNIADA